MISNSRTQFYPGHFPSRSGGTARTRQTTYDLLTKRDISELIERRKAELMAAKKMT